jgi:hypothetical protein
MGDKCVQAVLRVDDADDGARSCFRRASSFSASLVADWPTDRQIQTWTVNSLRISAATDNAVEKEVTKAVNAKPAGETERGSAEAHPRKG